MKYHHFKMIPKFKKLLRQKRKTHDDTVAIRGGAIFSKIPNFDIWKIDKSYGTNMKPLISSRGQSASTSGTVAGGSVLLDRKLSNLHFGKREKKIKF